MPLCHWPIPPNSPLLQFSLLLEGQEQPRVQDVLLWLPAVVSGKAQSRAGELHPGGLRGTAPTALRELGSLWEGRASQKSLKLVSSLASNPQANCHLKPQQATRGLNSLHWEENKPNKEPSCRGNPLGLARSQGGTGRQVGEGEPGGRSRNKVADRYHRVRGQGTGVWGGGTGRGWGPGRRVAGQLQRKPFPEKAGSPSLIEKKASSGRGWE